MSWDCNIGILQHTATHCNTLQHTARHIYVLRLQYRYLAHHAVRFWRSPRRWPRGATNPVQIRWKSHVSFPLSWERWPSLIRRHHVGVSPHILCCRLWQWYRRVQWKPCNFLGNNVARLFMSSNDALQKMQFWGTIKSWQVCSRGYETQSGGKLPQIRLSSNQNRSESQYSCIVQEPLNRGKYAYKGVFVRDGVRKRCSVSKIPPVQAKNQIITASVFLSTLQLTALLLQSFRLRLHCYTLSYHNDEG